MCITIMVLLEITLKSLDVCSKIHPFGERKSALDMMVSFGHDGVT